MDSRPVWSIDEQIETGNLPEPTLLAPSPERESLMQGPVETGGVPAMVDEDTEIEGNTFLKGRIIHSEDD